MRKKPKLRSGEARLGSEVQAGGSRLDLGYWLTCCGIGYAGCHMLGLSFSPNVLAQMVFSWRAYRWVVLCVSFHPTPTLSCAFAVPVSVRRRPNCGPELEWGRWFLTCVPHPSRAGGQSEQLRRCPGPLSSCISSWHSCQRHKPVSWERGVAGWDSGRRSRNRPRVGFFRALGAQWWLQNLGAGRHWLIICAGSVNKGS